MILGTLEGLDAQDRSLDEARPNSERDKAMPMKTVWSTRRVRIGEGKKAASVSRGTLPSAGLRHADEDKLNDQEDSGEWRLDAKCANSDCRTACIKAP